MIGKLIGLIALFIFIDFVSTQFDETTISETDVYTSTRGIFQNDTTILLSSTSPSEPFSSSEDLDTLSTVNEGNITEDATATETPYTSSSDTSSTSTTCDDSSFCENGGTCVAQGGVASSEECICPKHYAGIHCQILDNCTTNDDGMLCKNGACVVDQSFNFRRCRCFLGSFWDSVKAECRFAEEPCFPNPCKYGGTCSVKSAGEYACLCPKRYLGKNCEMKDTCSSSEGGAECENGYCVMDPNNNNKICQCIDGFYLDPSSMQCKKKSPPCKPNPCLNDGFCAGSSPEQYNCTCKANYTGERCEILDKCHPSKNGDICKNGSCKLNGTGSRICFCSDGFYFEEHSAECKKTSPPCEPNPCSNDGVCDVISSSEYNCTCNEMFYGKGCTLIDKCILEGNAFCKAAKCIMKKDNDGYRCLCPSGQYFDYRTRECEVIDMCPLFIIKSNAVCVKNNVTCVEHFKENNETGLCEPNFCTTKGCPESGMVCKENLKNPQNYRCSCKTGYSFNGHTCQAAFCTISSLNNCEQLCEEDGAGFTCKCNDMFIARADNRTCEYSSNVTCQNTTCKIGQCVVGDGGEERCICPPGYEEHEKQCIDKCSASNLPPNVCPDNRCEATTTGFRCRCLGKYMFSADNATCIAKPMCSENEQGYIFCSRRNAMCMEDFNSTMGYVCKCPIGTLEMENGTCKGICEFEENQRKCSLLGATCSVNRNFNFTCRCPPSFEKPQDGARCSKLAQYSYLVKMPVAKESYIKRLSMDRLISRTVQVVNVDYHKLWTDITDSMMGLYEAFENANILHCSPVENFVLCTVELQFRETNTQSLIRIKDAQTCTTNTRRKDNLCLIPPSLLLRKDKIQSHVSFERTDPCSSLIKNGLCESTTDCKTSFERLSFSCTCKAGFQVHKLMYPLKDTNSVIETCNDIDECALRRPCPGGTKCSNTIGSYNCYCLPGYRALSDSVDPKEKGCKRVCEANTCVHGTCKATGDHSFECSCNAGFKGTLCNIEDKNYKDAKVNTIIVGAVLGGVLLIVIIVFTSKMSRTQKKTNNDSGQLIFGATEMTERRVAGGILNDAFERE